MSTTYLTPDEQIYTAQAATLKKGGLQALRDLGAEYAEEPTLNAYPSPLRWLWLLWISLSGWLVPAGCAGAIVLLCGLLFGLPAALCVVSCPLMLLLAKKRLQDVPSAFLGLVSVGFALAHNPIGLALSLFAGLSVKESTLFLLPALCVGWLLSGGALVPLGISLSAGLMLWLLSLWFIFGHDLPQILLAAKQGHNTDYTKAEQRGAPHRLLLDLFIVSPVAVCAALWFHPLVLGATVITIVLAHSLAPVRNIRLILIADIILRCMIATALPLWVLPLFTCVDAFIVWKIRHINDPVTSALISIF